MWPLFTDFSFESQGQAPDVCPLARQSRRAARNMSFLNSAYGAALAAKFASLVKASCFLFRENELPRNGFSRGSLLSRQTYHNREDFLNPTSNENAKRVAWLASRVGGQPANSVLLKNCASTVCKWIAKYRHRSYMTTGRLRPATALTGSSKVVSKTATNSRGPTTDLPEITRLPPWFFTELERQTNERRHTGNEE
ncbi:MAG: hypothetical protein ONB48_00530 [candidate division KSB1 bacterium]|nr:hypothetical protein [candidate division KSB1 bacterium]MDZ7272838.1 hypothetical protein [candidate division KSB1 bacterium]MDZ7284139.1 hypothetical protein [candidate division KSB1 bacterium]MDZ7297463.1 hypothetical protein [candidate division KSB1 bacterium]MDZ7305599.1 hypothetical protein [candidate division KSB1 bacterium]